MGDIEPLAVLQLLKTTFACCQAMMFGKMWSNVKTKMDFIQWLGPDLSTKVLTYLDDPSDLVRVCAVSRSWYRFGDTFDFYYLLCQQFIM